LTNGGIIFIGQVYSLPAQNDRAPAVSAGLSARLVGAWRLVSVETVNEFTFAAVAFQKAGLEPHALEELSRLPCKGASLASILTALSILVGAFIAYVSAALGGRLRDVHP
jgi:hypothetical protein